ncbi:MAG: hypothetical protein B0D92_03440 [Spirochaeta sp. LUC14_002_19_P3]|nr:MAG: hypothetical protein B0D92_03440 [Spirochaeta sp. LUC14_002_19_P3]
MLSHSFCGKYFDNKDMKHTVNYRLQGNRQASGALKRKKGRTGSKGIKAQAKYSQSRRASPLDRNKTTGTNAPRSQQSKRLDLGTLILIGIALILLIVLIYFLFRGGEFALTKGNEQQPVIERTVSNNAPEKSVEPVLELGAPLAEEELSTDSTEEEPEIPRETVQARLFFIKVIDEKRIVTKSVLREVPSSAAPMTQAINTLLSGPNAGELNNGMLTLIPKDSKLIGAKVESRVAFLDFNENFRFNTLGIDGHRAQVEQIVYTATEFASVDKVQILIEGQKIDYLGGEGYWVGSPLGRDDFK